MHPKVKLASVKYFTKAAYAFWLLRSNYSILAYRVGLPKLAGEKESEWKLSQQMREEKRKKSCTN